MPVKNKNVTNKSSKTLKKTGHSSRRKNITYETEYKVLKPFLEIENIEKALFVLKGLEKKVRYLKYRKKENKVLIDTLKFIAFSKFNKISDCLNLLKTLDVTFDSIDEKDSLLYIDFIMAKSDVYWKIGKQKEALKLLLNLEKQFAHQQLSIDVLERIGDLFNIKGIIYWLSGEVQESQNSFQHSLSIMGRVGNKEKFTRELNNLGNVFVYKGELNVALDLHIQALEIRMQLGIRNEIASSLGNIAEIYHYKGEYEKSLENYLQAKDLFEEIENVLFQSKLYYQLITLHLEYDKIAEAKSVLDLLDRLRKENQSNDYIQLLFKFSEALYFKKSERLLDKFHAAINFNAIVNGKEIDNELTVQAILNLTDILLLEIRLSNNEQILEDIQKYCSKVHNIANSQNSAVLMVQGLLLESKLHLLDFKVQEAKALLSKAVAISQEKGISRFEFFASKELDKLLQMEEKWEDLKERFAPLSERLDLTGIEETLLSLTRKREEEIEIEREEPVLFIILQEGGLTAFSSKFREVIKIDDQLIGGFISAVNTFGRQIFSTTGQVERIKHGEYTLISKIVLNKFTFCYAFKGPSFLATKKFDKLIEKFLDHPLKKTFISNIRTGYLLDENEDKIMKDLVRECIFLSEEKENQLLSIIV